MHGIVTAKPVPASTRRGHYGLYPMSNAEMRQLGLLPALPEPRHLVGGAQDLRPPMIGRQRRWPTLAELNHYLREDDCNSRVRPPITLAPCRFLERRDLDDPLYEPPRAAADLAFRKAQDATG